MKPSERIDEIIKEKLERSLKFPLPGRPPLSPIFAIIKYLDEQYELNEKQNVQNTGDSN